MKTKLLSIAIVAFALVAPAQTNLNPEVKADWLAFKQGVASNANLTLALSPSYAPDVVNSEGKRDEWGAGLALAYRPKEDGILSHTFVGVQLDYIGSSFVSVSMAGGLKGEFQVKGQPFTIGAYGGAVKAVTGTDDNQWGAMAGTFVKTTVKHWDNLFGIGPANLDVGGAVEKWDRFKGNVYRPGVALSIAW